jgi:hypothetical protein
MSSRNELSCGSGTGLHSTSIVSNDRAIVNRLPCAHALAPAIVYTRVGDDDVAASVTAWRRLFERRTIPSLHRC